MVIRGFVFVGKKWDKIIFVRGQKVEATWLTQLSLRITHCTMPDFGFARNWDIAVIGSYTKRKP